ncbi:MAG: ribosomal large subunit pseudouridine synthase C [Bdellovibrio sp. ArHS]|uniref:RluA family pseudouridine synthase n=1 Tax=Bdellovibrio sp. ArHS TaxID=1569284 RepID=UPI000582CF6B|nr:RluA family pseudouridine synthase [Bdellovibrio sp. ArHS]KHD87889.1 MAG: ribosomal large subunit pseudouridine synthase C [Bdellovibrio sp. ArHS]
MIYNILFEDDYFLAAEKPAGLPSQPTVDKRRPDFFTSLKKQLKDERGTDFYLGLHHRLDRDTSGVMIFTKNKIANEPLAEMFKKHLIQKTYLCLTAPKKCPDQWEIKNHLTEVRDPVLKKIKMKSVHSGGDKAHTLFRKLKTFKKGHLIEAQPQSGRMHQIRVHLAEQGLGIFGDDIYPAPKNPTAPRLMLHALSLEFIHPFTKISIKIECPLPKDFQQMEQQLS